MDAMRKGWFSELIEVNPGQCMSLEVEKVLFDETSDYQKIQILQTTNHGRALILDGVIQTTDSDEFAYQEMLVHVPLNCHPNPANVLVIGGGDGGVVRELNKIPAVKTITMCELDGKVIEASKKFLPNLSVGFESPKLTLHVGDGFAFMKECKKAFDVIITDSSDPEGIAEQLFTKPYFELMRDALKPGGIICSQGESFWVELKLIRNMFDFCEKIFPVVDYCYCSVPTYLSGTIGFTMCSTDPTTDFKNPLREYSDEELEDLSLRYYNSAVHRAAFMLPQFAHQVVRKKKLL